MKCLETTVVYVYMYVAYTRRLVASLPLTHLLVAYSKVSRSCMREDLCENEATYMTRFVELCGASSVLTT